MATAAALLDEVETAIIDILQNGQEVQINGKRYSKANLKELQSFRDGLRAEVETASGGGMLRRAVAGIPRRS